MSEQPEKKNSWVGFTQKHPIIANLIYIAITAAILISIGFLFLNVWTHHGDTDEIPNVSDMTYDKAMNILESQGFQVEISDSVYDSRLKPGTVISTWPKPGAIVKPGREVYLTIASFQPRKVSISMPLVNVSSRQALKYLESLGIKNVRIVNVPSQFPDLVLGAKCKGMNITPGSMLPVNSEVTLEVGTVPTISEENLESEWQGNGHNEEFHNTSTTYEDNEDEPTSVAFD